MKYLSTFAVLYVVAVGSKTTFVVLYVYVRSVPTLCNVDDFEIRNSFYYSTQCLDLRA
jgi:hypothetical protein